MASTSRAPPKRTADFDKILEYFTYEPRIFEGRYNDESTRDMAISFVADDRQLRVHRDLMKALSPYWTEYLTNNPQFALFKSTDCCYEDVDDMIKILYGGREALLEVPRERWDSVIDAATKFHLKLFYNFDEV